MNPDTDYVHTAVINYEPTYIALSTVCDDYRRGRICLAEGADALAEAVRGYCLPMGLLPENLTADVDYSEMIRFVVYEDDEAGIEAGAVDDDPEYPIGETFPCYDCARERPTSTTTRDAEGWPAVPRECVALGPVTGRADPTQTYRLSCGHIAI